MLIGILQCGEYPAVSGYPEKTYTDLYSAMRSGHGFSFRTWDGEHLDFPATVKSADGWLLSGSKHGAYENHAFIPPLEEFIRKAYGEGIPMVGICFGHQIMAQALGGKVEKFAGGWTLGRKDYEFQGIPYALNAWHQDQVVAAPPEARTAAATPFCAHAGLLYNRRAMSMQPHPEFEADDMLRLAELNAAQISVQQISDAKASLSHDVSNQAMAESIAAFYKGDQPFPAIL